MRPAMASRWTTALVEPPMAPLTMMAFSNAARVSTCDRRKSSCTMPTMRRPVIWACSLRRASTAGMAALPGRATPSASTMAAMVEAVPIVMQCPLERDMHDSASLNWACVMRPLRTSSENFQTSVPEPIGLPR